MTYSNKNLAELWFEIYEQVVNENNVAEEALPLEQLSSVTTTIFIAVTQNRGMKRPAFFNKFQSEVLKLVGRIKDRQVQKSVYNSIKHILKEKR
jgi:coproporphyrinogen III oxidase-like Fe-S oxidoreductase|tara:strand:+ start:1896 stop:2177 length:282 start_codon:yes stop_codon:yes gene_type:complete